jgi:hypothetical protein
MVKLLFYFLGNSKEILQWNIKIGHDRFQFSTVSNSPIHHKTNPLLSQSGISRTKLWDLVHSVNLFPLLCVLVGVEKKVTQRRAKHDHFHEPLSFMARLPTKTRRNKRNGIK